MDYVSRRNLGLNMRTNFGSSMLKLAKTLNACYTQFLYLKMGKMIIADTVLAIHDNQEIYFRNYKSLLKCGY